MPYSWIGRLNVTKMAILQLIYKFNRIYIKTPTIIIVEIDKLILNSTWKDKEPRIVRVTFKKNVKFEEFI